MDRAVVSIVLATRNRANLLNSTLNSLFDQEVDAPWEVIVVDNGSVDETIDVLAKLSPRAPLSAVKEPLGGKSRALNTGLSHATGDIVAFTDDDVLFAPGWLKELTRAATMYPDGTVFCGPIYPIFPPGLSVSVSTSKFSALAFGRFTPRIGEGRLPAPLIPYGANFAVRRIAIGAFRFREDLGPSDQSRLMCEDVEFILRFRKRGDHFIYLPTAAVSHGVTSEGASFSAQFERAFNFGRSRIIMDGRIVTRYLNLRARVSDASVVDFLDLGISINVLYGQMYELEKIGQLSQLRVLQSFIPLSGWRGNPSLLSRSALEWLRKNPRYVPQFARSRVVLP